MLIHCQGKLTYDHPAIDGITTVQGLSRDWQPSDRWANDATAEYIPPLKAVAPAGDLRPQSMSGWTPHLSYNQSWRQVWVPGNPPAIGYEFYDGTAYAAGTAATTYAGSLSLEGPWEPNLTLITIRCAPPPDQGIVPQTVVSVYASVRVTTVGDEKYLDSNGTWTDGLVAFALPFQSETYRSPSLSWFGDREGGGYIADVNIFSEGRSSQCLEGGVSREAWSLEYIEDADRFEGGHILIRGSSSPNEWWHYYDANIRLVAGPIVIGAAGCRQVVNCSPIYYSNGSGLYGATTTVCRAWASKHELLPTDEYETDVSWGAIYSPADTADYETWDVEVTAKDAELVCTSVGYRPLVTFTPTLANDDKRPVLWIATEDHAATIAVPAGLPAAQTTEGNADLLDLDLRFNSKWRGAGGTATFRRGDEAIYDDWLERGRVAVNLGWQTDPDPGEGLEADDLCTLWIAPGGIKRGRAGITEIGRPGLTVELCDLVKARLQDNAIVDLGQAGGIEAESWFQACGNRLGLPASRVYVAPAIAETLLPAAQPIPSTPNLKARDGQKWEQHFDEVCKATGLRWGYNPFTGKLFLDGGKAAYEDGVSEIAFTLDYDTLTEPEVFFDIGYERNGENIRNRYKVNFGDEAYRQAEYYVTSVPDEIQDAGGDLWAVADQTDAQTINDILQSLDVQYRTDFAEIQFTTFLRRSLQPDQFVEIGDCPEVGLTAGQVFQVTDIRHSRSQETTVVTAVWVYTPEGGYW